MLLTPSSATHCWRDASLPQAPNEDEALKEVVEVSFSGDEVGGRYLDVHEHFRNYVNAKFGKQLDYLEYLTSFSDVSGITRQFRLSKPYRQATLLPTSKRQRQKHTYKHPIHATFLDDICRRFAPCAFV